jgi:hypothetical protein
LSHQFHVLNKNSKVRPRSRHKTLRPYCRTNSFFETKTLLCDHIVAPNPRLKLKLQKSEMDNGKRTCPCCACSQEDRDHIIRCPSPARKAWREVIVEQLSTTCAKHHTFGPLQALLMNAIQLWLYPDDNPHDIIPQCADYAEELHPLIRAQTKIGWRHFFNGRFCVHWSTLQSEHLYQIRHHLPVKNKTGHSWQVAIITVLWEQWYILWKLRNEDVHGKDTVSRAIADKREVARGLSRIYDQRNHMEPSMQDHLHPDVETHMERSSMAAIKSWMQIRGPGFAESVKQVKKKAIQNVRSIRTYFSAGAASEAPV